MKFVFKEHLIHKVKGQSLDWDNHFFYREFDPLANFVTEGVKYTG